MQPTYTKIPEAIDAKKFEKPVLKYVKSAKEMVRATENSSLLGQYTKGSKV